MRVGVAAGACTGGGRTGADVSTGLGGSGTLGVGEATEGDVTAETFVAGDAEGVGWRLDQARTPITAATERVPATPTIASVFFGRPGTPRPVFAEGAIVPRDP